MTSSAKDKKVIFCCYTNQELSSGLQSFDEDHNIMSKGEGFRLGSSFTTKTVMIGIFVWMCAFSWYEWGFGPTFKQLSYWVIIL